MAPLKQIVERYLGVRPALSGEGTRWQWQTSGWFASTPAWIFALVVVLVLAGIVLLYRRDGRSLRWRRRWTLAALRATAMGVLFFLLLQVTLTVHRTGLPELVIMIDDSASMLFRDDYSGTDDASTLRRLVDSETSPTRDRVTRELLLSEQSDLLAELASRYRLRVYRFSEQARPLTGDSQTDLAQLQAAIQEPGGQGQETRPAAAVRGVLDELRGALPTAVVLFTDGISTAGPEQRLTRLATRENRTAVPLYVVGVGSTKPTSDLEIREVRVDEIAIVDETILFSAELNAQGFDGRTVRIEIRDEATGEQLATDQVRITDTVMTVELSHVPPAAGEFDYTFRVVPEEDEQLTENNQLTRHVSVRDGRIRVLLADTLPRYEYRYLKHVLERNDGRSGSIELHTVLFDADPEWHAQDTSASALGGRMPSSLEELSGYDVVILGDVGTEYLSPGTQLALRDFVREKGGGLVFVAGRLHNPHAYRGTQLEPLIPASLSGVTSAAFRTLGASGVQLEPTLSGQRGTSLFRFGESAVESSRALAAFPELYSSLQLDELSAGANVLAQQSGSGQPLIVAQQYGAGRSVLHATDDLWMLRFRAGDEYFGRYWVSLIRYLSRSSLLGRDRAAELVTDRETYDRGENVEFQLRFLDSRSEPASRVAEVTVERRGGASRIVRLRPSTRFPDVFTGTLSAPADGSYHAWVSDPVFEDSPPASDFRVQNSARELLVRRIDRAGMQAAARATRGRYYSPATARALPRDLPRGRSVTIETGEPIRLWSRAEPLLLFVVLLTLEWFLRKNARLI